MTSINVSSPNVSASPARSKRRLWGGLVLRDPRGLGLFFDPAPNAR